jgi:cyanophycinase
MTQPKGTLIIIGGHEERGESQKREILAEVASRARGGGSLVVVTVATASNPDTGAAYVRVFRDLGVHSPRVLPLRSRDDALSDTVIEQMQKATVVFFTGGDQLRITSQLGDSAVYRCLHEIYRRGGTIAGTSAGAAAMSETMVIGGAGDESPGISALRMAPGLALIPNVVIDSHFAERGRIGRLLGAVAQNPANLGVGIDEDTAIVVERGEQFRVLGSGATYVVDGSHITYSGLSETQPEGVLAIHNVTLHVLGNDDCFDLNARKPLIPNVNGKDKQEEKS